MERQVATVFTADDGAFGNEVAIVLLSGELPSAVERQELASAGPEPAIVFIAADRTTVRIHNRKLERQFAGHPLLGAAAVLRTRGPAPERFAVPAGDVEVWSDGQREWLFAPSKWSPRTSHRQLESAAEVESLPGAPADEPVQVWAWLDEPTGVIRARMFAPSEGKPEDEACGSASMLLATILARDLTVVHGKGSVIHVRPRSLGVDLGGRCAVQA